MIWEPQVVPVDIPLLGPDTSPTVTICAAQNYCRTHMLFVVCDRPPGHDGDHGPEGHRWAP